MTVVFTQTVKLPTVITFSQGVVTLLGAGTLLGIVTLLGEVTLLGVVEF